MMFRLFVVEVEDEVEVEVEVVVAFLSLAHVIGRWEEDVEGSCSCVFAYVVFVELFVVLGGDSAAFVLCKPS